MIPCIFDLLGLFLYQPCTLGAGKVFPIRTTDFKFEGTRVFRVEAF